jgi:hypothetical protein
MSNPITNLLDARQRLVSKIAELNDELKSVDNQLFSRIQKLSEAFDGSAASIQIVDRPNFFRNEHLISAEPTSGRRKGRTLAQPVERILRERGTLTTKELYTELINRQIPVNGQRPMANLAAHLTHMENVEKTEGGWALKENAHAE